MKILQENKGKIIYFVFGGERKKLVFCEKKSSSCKILRTKLNRSNF